MESSTQTATGATLEDPALARVKSFHLAESQRRENLRQASLDTAKDSRPVTADDLDRRRQSMPDCRTSTTHHLGSSPTSKEGDRGAPKGQNSGVAESRVKTGEPPISEDQQDHSAFAATNIVINSLSKLGASGGKEGAFFSDGKRRVDFVLVYEQGRAETGGQEGQIVDKDQHRAFFEKNLIEAGLNLEEDAHLYETGQSSSTLARRPSGNPALILEALDPNATSPRSAIFVKIHAPFEVLCAQAEKLNLKMPLQMTDPYVEGPTAEGGDSDEAENVFVQFLNYLKKLGAIFCRKSSGSHGVVVNLSLANAPNGHAAGLANGDAGLPAEAWSRGKIAWPFTRKRIEMFDLGDDPSVTFFTPTKRLEIVWNMLQQARNDPDDEKRRGIDRLLDTGVYDKAFALHDGDCEYHGDSTSAPTSYHCQREKLRRIWASWRSVFRRQPLELVRSYFGEKAGFYFAFLGFYTKMLTFPAVFGLCSFLYGMFNTSEDVIVRDICNVDGPPGNFIMCPMCHPPNCRFTQLSDGCDNAKWDYRMDNEATLVVSVLTVVWAICMLKMWKRREAELAYQWDTYDVEQEDVVIRPQYEERAPKKRRNPITREMEPFVPPLAKASWVLASCCVTFFVLCLVGVALALLVLARIALYGAFQPIVTENVECARWFVHGLIFVVVFVSENVYHHLAHKLTSLECPRTQEAWLSSFLWKVFIFELLNDFVPIAYAAWAKGKMTKTPLDLNWHSELCDIGGCMGEVTELTAVLLLMRLVVGNAAEVGWPFAKNLYKKFVRRRQEVAQRSVHTALRDAQLGTSIGKESETRMTRWHADYLLNDPELDGVAGEYMEMMIQFAFCTLFVSAFPLAPLVCLLNNILEIRVDAINFVRATRRPIPIRVAGIQIWNDFLSIISKLAIICNAGLIAFTSTIVPRLYYKYAFSPIGSYENYTQFSVSKIHQSAWEVEEVKDAFNHHNISECYYEDYRHSEPPYQHIQHWWEVNCVRLAVFSAFALLGFAFEWLFNFAVDDTPSHVSLTIQRRRYFVTKAIEAYEEKEKRRGTALGHLVEDASKQTAVYAGPSKESGARGERASV